MKKIHIATYQEASRKLADSLPDFGTSVIIRLGGSMPYKDYDITVNSVDAIKNSINKATQKQLLINADIQTLPLLKMPAYPCIVKGIIRSNGTSVFLVKNEVEFKKAVAELRHLFLMEPLFNATSEYRLHCTRDEVFFMVKKVKKNPADVIITGKNHYNIKEFVKPRLIEQIKAECLKAMKVLDLDIACFDVMYDATDPNKHVFTIAEANTNPELLTNTYNAYNTALIKVVNKKIEEKRKACIKQYPRKPAECVNVIMPKAQPVIKENIKNAVLTDKQKMIAIDAIVNDKEWITNLLINI